MQEQVTAKIRAKKVEKCRKLFSKNQSKKYKKFVLLKRYTEDYENQANKSQDGNLFMQLESLKTKYKKVRQAQLDKEQPTPDERQGEEVGTLQEIVSDIKEEYFSDLNPEDIPNSEVSDVDPDELAQDETKLGNLEQGEDMNQKIQVTKQLTD